MKVYITPAAYMQRIQDHARAGYHWYVSGHFVGPDLAKVHPFALKLDSLYSTDLTPMQRSRKKKLGEASCYLLGYWDEKHTRLDWILLASDGENLFHEREKKQDLRAKGSRVPFRGYELLQTTRPAAFGGGQSWTWRLAETSYKQLETELKTLVQHSDEAIQKRLTQLVRVIPLFRGSRAQMKRLWTTFKREWVVKRGNAPLPKLPELPFMKRQADQLMPIENIGLIATIEQTFQPG